MPQLPPLPPWDGGPDITVPDRPYDTDRQPYAARDDRPFWNWPPDYPKDNS